MLAPVLTALLGEVITLEKLLGEEPERVDPMKKAKAGQRKMERILREHAKRKQEEKPCPAS